MAIQKGMVEEGPRLTERRSQGRNDHYEWSLEKHGNQCGMSAVVGQSWDNVPMAIFFGST
jgi:hypothetical protein